MARAEKSSIQHDPNVHTSLNLRQPIFLRLLGTE